MRFLYQVTLGRPAEIKQLPFAKRPRRLPTVLSPAEAVQLLEAAQLGRDRLLLELAYRCGLRLKELVGLQVAGRVTGARPPRRQGPVVALGRM